MGLKEDFQDITPSKCLMLGFVLCIVYYFLFFNKGSGIIQQMNSMQTDINDKKNRLAEVKRAMDNKTAFETEVTALTKDLEELLKYFPASMDMNQMQTDLTARLRDTNNKLVLIKDGEAVSRFSGYSEHGVFVESMGGFHELMSFLSSVTKMNRVVDFRSMEFESSDASDEYSMIKFKINMSVFSLNRSDDKDDSKTKPKPKHKPGKK